MDIFLGFFGGFVIGGGAIWMFSKTARDTTKTLTQKIDSLETENKRLIEEKGTLKAQIQTQDDWERKITETVKATSEKTNNTLVHHLLDTHKKQVDTTQKTVHDIFKEKEQKFYENIENLTGTVKILKSDVEKNQELGETLKNAFSSSANIGYAVETILENTLENFKFRKGIDFFTQFSTQNLRADAIVILPDNNALVIDSKASKFIYELAEAEKSNDTIKIQDAKKHLLQSMNTHLNTLASKNYADEVQKELNSKDHTSILRENIPTIMFVASESAIEKIQSIDSSFQTRASEKGIFVCGPTGLWIAIGIAKQKVELHKKIKNYEHIEKFSTSVLKNVQKIFKDAHAISKGLAQAQKGYNAMTQTLNSNIPARVREMEKLGIAPHPDIDTIAPIGDTNMPLENKTDI